MILLILIILLSIISISLSIYYITNSSSGKSPPQPAPLGPPSPTPPKTQMYKCNIDNTCSQDDSGTYSYETSCLENCKRYDCDSGKCVKSGDTGQYDNEVNCNKSCTSPPGPPPGPPKTQMYKCNIDNTCSQDDSGTYSYETSCSENCKRYDCDSGKCVKSGDTGHYDNEVNCNKSCTSPPGPPPGPPGSCPHTYITEIQCPPRTPSSSGSSWPPKGLLPTCEVIDDSGKDYTDYKQVPCINKAATGGADSTSSAPASNLWEQCFQKSNPPTVAECPIGTVCAAGSDPNNPGRSEWAQCIPHCDEANSVITSCCNLESGCKNCISMPAGGNCEHTNTTFNKNTKWLKAKIDKICTYPGSNGKNFYYDGGSACNETLCTSYGGVWKSVTDPGVKFNSNVFVTKDDLSNNFTATTQKLNDKTVYNLDKEFDVPKDKCKSITSVIDKNKNIYTLVSIKPSKWSCSSFSEWDSCSENACISNCENNFPTYNCAELCKPVNLQDPNLKVQASTTDFGFGAATSCMCNGADIMKQLTNYNGSNEPYSTGEKEYWVGVATPSWIQSPFDTDKISGIAGGGSTIANDYGDQYTSNCSIGNGGCGTCWKLTNNADSRQVINAVVIDTCEDKNAYGNNYNWCVAQRPDVMNWKPNPDATYAGNWPPFYAELPITTTNTLNGDNRMEWKSDSDACFDDKGNFICKNMDFHPVHFDVATQNVPAGLVKRIGIWPESTNPRVTAERIQCPKKLKEEILNKHCGSNAGSTATPKQYCPGVSDKMCTSDKNVNVGLWPDGNCSPSPGPPGPPPPPGPPGPPSPPAVYCWYNNCIQNNCANVNSPKDYCSMCEQQQQLGLGGQSTIDFSQASKWEDVKWVDNDPQNPYIYSGLEDWTKHSKTHQAICGYK